MPAPERITPIATPGVIISTAGPRCNVTSDTDCPAVEPGGTQPRMLVARSPRPGAEESTDGPGGRGIRRCSGPTGGERLELVRSAVDAWVKCHHRLDDIRHSAPHC